MTHYSLKPKFIVQFQRGIFLVVCFFWSSLGFGQPYYVPLGYLYGYDVGDNYCTGCIFHQHGQNYVDSWGGVSFGPDGVLYGLSSAGAVNPVLRNNIQSIDLITGIGTLVFDGPDNMEQMDGLLAVGGGIFYTVRAQSNILFKWDINTGTITEETMPFNAYGDIWMAAGEAYFLSWVVGDLNRHIVRVNLANPSECEIVCSINNQYGIFGLTATPVKEIFIGQDLWMPGQHIVKINIVDCTIEEICEFHLVSGAIDRITSPYEHNLDPISDNYIDLDCNDSSGADEADFNSNPVDCLTEGGAPVNDDDVFIRAQARIQQLTVTIPDPVDDPEEFLEMSAMIPGITTVGSGTKMITLNNNGTAKIGDFIAALNLIRYFNEALHPTAGIRLVEVQFTTVNGDESNIANAYIEVIELENLEVDLGPDITICDDESALIDAGVNNAEYIWSTGDISQSISVNEGGTYSVTVSDGEVCPGTDDVYVEVLPVITVALTGDSVICQNGPALLTIESNAPFPISVEISATPGFSFTIDDFEGYYSFSESPPVTTEYSIINIITSSPACIHLPDPDQIIMVAADIITSVDLSACSGDSLEIGGTLIDQSGIYYDTLQAASGCDSMITYNISLDISPVIQLNNTTCDPDAAGVFTTYLTNSNGCDTVVQTFVELLPLDTTLIHLTTCASSDSGIFHDTLINVHGCDSLVTTTIEWIPPQDTTRLIEYACDSSETGTYPSSFTDVLGCDSIVLLHVLWGSSDTTYLEDYSCDSSQLGIFIQQLTAINACDSIVITEVSYSEKDSTFLTSSTCDPSAAGMFVTTLQSSLGCDSIVFLHVTLAESHVVFLEETTCDPLIAGVVTDTLINRYGCDSIIMTTIALLPSDEIMLTSNTCHEHESGVFETTYINQWGCDSIVIHVVTHVPPDTTFQSSYTCFSDQTGTQVSVFPSASGCDSVNIHQTLLFNLPVAEFIITSDYHDYAVSCHDGMDGSALVEVTGEGPWMFEWSHGAEDQSLDGMQAGYYEVTITDQNGCTAIAAGELNEPLTFDFGLIVNHPSCFDQSSGTISIEASGGTEPIQYSIDGIAFQSSPDFMNVSGGIYQVTAIDGNNCKAQHALWINVPLLVDLEMGADIVTFPGDSVPLHAMINIPYDSLIGIAWTGLTNAGCDQCLTQIVAPVITSTYSLEVTTVDGCKDADELTVFIKRQDDVYIPNVFSPNGDGINDLLQISAGLQVDRIVTMVIYDRWGNQVFSASDYAPNSDDHSWDGTYHGQSVNPGVFAYNLIVQLHGGDTAQFHGDVTVVR